MTVIDRDASRADVAYGLWDADQHYYEPVDALTRYLDPAFRSSIKWIEMDGHRRLMVNQKLVLNIPNPTFDPVAVPGSLEPYFRLANHEGKALRDIIAVQPIQSEYRDRATRIARLDAQGVEFAWLLPTLGLGLEELLCDDPAALHAVITAFNRWLEDDWGFDRDGRIQAAPMMSLADPIEAENETRRLLDLGARVFTFRPAPTQAGRQFRSIADKRHDRVFAMIAEAGAVVALHTADSGYSIHTERWGGATRFDGFKTSTLGEVMGIQTDRPVHDTLAAMVCDGLFDRQPKLRVACLELGSGWMTNLVRRFRISYGKTPQLYRRDPVEQMREHVWVAPFYEDDIDSLRDHIGADRILLGSDWPHPEGLGFPRQWIGDFTTLSADEQRLVLRDNLRALVGRG
ncbi:MAG: amidohydrolase family protein [Acidimicrobiia bacterium]